MKIVKRIIVVLLFFLTLNSSWMGATALDNDSSVVDENTEVVDENTEPEASTLVNEEFGVSVTGNLPEDVELSVVEEDLNQVKEIVETKMDAPIIDVPENHKLLNVSLVKDNEEIQPEETVSVTLKVDDIGVVGDEIFVYHMHENDDGTITPELLGPFVVNDNGEIVFEMKGFSYLLTFGTSINFPIESFYYKFENPPGHPGQLIQNAPGNDFYLIGFYYDSSNNLHFLLATAEQPSNQNYSNRFKYFYINNNWTNVVWNGPDKNVTEQIVAKYKTIYFDHNPMQSNYIDRVIMNTDAYGYLDVKVGQVKLDKNLYFGISDGSNLTVPDSPTSSGWYSFKNLNFDLKYSINKKVYATTSEGWLIDIFSFGETANFNPKDWVYYEIEINNSIINNIPINLLLTDLFPSGVFDESTIKVSDNVGLSWSSPTWIDPSNHSQGIKLFEGTLQNIALQNNKKFYIKAKTKSFSQIDKSNGNTFASDAKITGNVLITTKDSASIILSPQATSIFTINKQVDKEYAGDTLPNPADSFQFNISMGVATDSFVYKIYELIEGVETLVSSGIIYGGGYTNTIYLKGGQYAKIEYDPNEPNISYNVTEVANSNYTTKVNGVEGYTASGTLPSAGHSVTFLNTLKAQTADLTIQRSGASSTDQSFIYGITNATGTYNLTVVINENGSVTIKDLPKGNYTVTEKTNWSWRYNTVAKTVNLLNNSTVTFDNTPSNTQWLSGDSYMNNGYSQ